jgi:hypothetical protein
VKDGTGGARKNQPHLGMNPYWNRLRRFPTRQSVNSNPDETHCGHQRRRPHGHSSVYTPRLRDFAARGAKTAITPAFPAVTCTAQSTYLTGAPPASHGVVGNGWYNRELAEVQFWKQSNHIVHGRKIWTGCAPARIHLRETFWCAACIRAQTIPSPAPCIRPMGRF